MSEGDHPSVAEGDDQGMTKDRDDEGTIEDDDTEMGADEDVTDPSREPARLLADVMLGKLARYLRMCGHDVAYAMDRDAEADAEVLAWAREEDRLVLTRDGNLAERAPDALLLESRDIADQLREVRAGGIDLALTEPTRCAACNGTLVRLPANAETPADVPDPDGTAVYRCPDCGKHFWRGSHWDDVAGTLAGL